MNISLVTQAAALVTALGTIGGAALYLDKAHVPVAELDKHIDDFQQYIEQEQEADERNYVRELKKEIREIRFQLITQPDNEYLIESLADLTFLLCEVRPDDGMCSD